VTAPVVQATAAVSDGLASAASQVAATPGAGAVADAAHATVAAGAAAAGAAADVSAAASAALAEAVAAATPGLSALSGAAAPIADVAGTVHDSLGAAASAAAGAFDPPPFDPTMLPHLLGTLEGRILLVTLLSLAAAGRASGLGGFTFAQPVLVGCRSSLKLAFGPVRLIPCAAGAAVQSAAGVAGDAFEGAGRVVQRIRGSGGSNRPANPQPRTILAARAGRGSSAAAAGLVARPVAAGGQMLLRLLVSVLAALSALFAGAAALEREKRERVRQPYRRRLHS
jgi:hypothetical protein